MMYVFGTIRKHDTGRLIAVLDSEAKAMIGNLFRNLGGPVARIRSHGR